MKNDDALDSLIALAKRHDRPPDDAEAHEVLLCVQTGKRLSDETRWKFGTDQLFVKGADDMRSAFSDEAVPLFRTRIDRRLPEWIGALVASDARMLAIGGAKPAAAISLRGSTTAETPFNDWAVYHIMMAYFANGAAANDRANMRRWVHRQYAGGDLQGVLAIPGQQDFVAVATQCAAQQFPDRGIVVDDENPTA